MIQSIILTVIIPFAVIFGWHWYDAQKKIKAAIDRGVAEAQAEKEKANDK